MIKYYIYIVLIAFSAELFASQNKFTINIKTNMASAAIFINSKLAGTGSAIYETERDTNFIAIKKSLNEWGKAFIEDTVIFAGSDNARDLSYNLDEDILIDSSPQDAAVKNGEKHLGRTPLFVNKNISSLLLYKKNYEPKKIFIKDEKARNISLSFNGKIRKESFIDSDWFPALIGSALVLGGTAAYFKIEADKTFEEYKKTMDQSLLDKTDRYDLYSGIALGALQVNFGYLIYKLLIE